MGFFRIRDALVEPFLFAILISLRNDQTSVENAKKIVQRARARLLACMQQKLRWET